MTRAQKQLRAWAYGLARSTLAKVNAQKTGEVRVSMLKSILDSIQPGMSGVVEKRTITFRRLGHTYDMALEHALAEQFMQMGAKKLTQAETLGDNDAPAGGTSRTEDILGGITRVVASVTEAASRVHSMVEESLTRREEQRQARREWRTAADREAAEAEARIAAEQEERELAREREDEELLRERDRPSAAPSGPSIGGILMVGGALTLVGVGGYYGYKAIKSRKAAS